jgi:hypothetical protein
VSTRLIWMRRRWRRARTRMCGTVIARFAICKCPYAVGEPLGSKTHQDARNGIQRHRGVGPQPPEPWAPQALDPPRRPSPLPTATCCRQSVRELLRLLLHGGSRRSLVRYLGALTSRRNLVAPAARHLPQ